MTKTVSLDQDILNTMTDEERAAIEESSDEEIASLKATGAEKDPAHAGSLADVTDEDDDDADDAAGAAAADEGAAAAQAAEAAAAATAAAPGAEGAAAAPAGEAAAAVAAPAVAAAPAPAPQAPAPTYRYELPADFDERMAAMRTANTDALDKFEAGEFTREQLVAEQDRIATERRELESMQTRADVARDMQKQANDQYRDQAVNRLFADAAKPEGGGVDYRKDAGKFRDLDSFLKALAADEANADKPLDWFLDEAHRRVKALHGIGAAGAPAPTPAAAAKTPEQIKAEAAAARKPDLGGAKDLSQVPGGQGNDDVGGEFEDIMSLDGDAFEAAIARMAKSQPERWARFQAQQQ